MIIFTPSRIVLLVVAGLVGTIVGALTGAFFGLFGWTGIELTVAFATLGALVMIAVVDRASIVQRIRLIIGLILGAMFGAAWGWLGQGTLTNVLGQGANWAAYGAIISFTTRESILRVRRWAMRGAIGGMIIGLIMIVTNLRLSFGSAFTLQPHNGIGEALGTIVLMTFFGAFWVSVYGLQHLTNAGEKSPPSNQSSQPEPRRLRPIRKVVR